MKTFLHHPITRVILSTLLLVAGLAAVKSVITKPFFLWAMPTEGAAMLATALTSCALLILIYYLLLKYYWQRPPWQEFKIRSGLAQGLGGFLLGFGILGLVLLVLGGAGYFQITGREAWMNFLPGATVVLGGVIMEELIFRGFLFYQLEKWRGTWTAVIISAILFQLPHFGNPGEDILPALLGVLFGAAHALMYAVTRQLWLPIAFHFGWNIVMPTFGITLSGVEGFGALFTSQMDGPVLLTGSSFGLEDSLLSMLGLALFTGLLAWRWQQTTKKDNLEVS
ncbi:MAG: CPBP family intramembrane glutamic endopeptidase [Bacteroidota bacterium]